MDVMRSTEERMKKQVRELTNENKKYSARLKSNKATLSQLTRQLSNYEKDKLCLAVSIFVLIVWSH